MSNDSKKCEYNTKLHSGNKNNYIIWYNTVKNDLLKTEPQNILARARCLTEMVNNTIKELQLKLLLPKLDNINKYKCNINPMKHLLFLINWGGLRMENTKGIPTTLKEYERKSKNWLNGRRAPNYGKTLFPWFLNEIDNYANKISLILTDNNKQRDILYNIIVFKIYAKLCGCSVSLHEQAKKAPFFCKNSVERKCKLRECLQLKAKDHQYVQGFPSCFEEAVGYFNQKSNEFIGKYNVIYNGHTIKTENNIKSNNDSDSILKLKDRIKILENELNEAKHKILKYKNENKELKFKLTNIGSNNSSNKNGIKLKQRIQNTAQMNRIQTANNMVPVFTQNIIPFNRPNNIMPYTFIFNGNIIPYNIIPKQ
mmetsp:Transcript_25623/g.31235  ORF Transcript_25623/g.31235 Transcript_25623/m.31235 type:complete len:368 (+) Transcript_25623:100-1203(+)